MAKLRKLVTIKTYAWYEAELTDEQVARWNASEENQDEIIEEVEDHFDLVRDKVLEDSDYPELIED
jgi:hypothetical protein